MGANRLSRRASVKPRAWSRRAGVTSLSLNKDEDSEGASRILVKIVHKVAIRIHTPLCPGSDRVTFYMDVSRRAPEERVNSTRRSAALALTLLAFLDIKERVVA